MAHSQHISHVNYGIMQCILVEIDRFEVKAWFFFLFLAVADINMSTMEEAWDGERQWTEAPWLQIPVLESTNFLALD